MKLLAQAISILIASVVLAFLASSASIILSERIRSDQSNFPNSLISFGCELHAFAPQFLVAAMLFFGVDFLLKARKRDKQSERENTASWWQRAVQNGADPTPLEDLVSAFGRVALVLFFISLLSYLWDYCRVVG